MKRSLACVLALCVPVAVSLAEVPVRSEQLIWSVLAFNGRDYAATFAPQSADTIYILSGTDNFLSARKTLVYWWPITTEWQTDTDSLNIVFPGTLELQDRRGQVRAFPLSQFTYFNVKGEYELNWKVLTGEPAKAELDRYATLYESYYTSVNEYQLKSAAYDDEMQSLTTRITKLREEGKDFAALLERMKTLLKPDAPQPPTYYVVPPSELQPAFILNGPPGLYSMRLRNLDGTVMEGSEKNVVAHGRSRTGGIGYDVIPADKWTRPVESTTPASVLYVNGKADLFIRPFFEEEFNDLAYEKTVNNAARGNPTIVKWVRVQQVPHAKIAVEGPGAARGVRGEEPFTVQQTQGSSLGYTIVPYDPQGASKGKDPDIIAFRLSVGKGTRLIRIRALDSGR